MFKYFEVINPKRFPFFYGWVIVFAATIGFIVTIPSQTIWISVFADALIEDWKISRLQLSQAYGIGTFASALFLTWAGKMYDKFGTLKTTISSILLFGGIMLFLPGISIYTTKISNYFPKVNYNFIAFILASGAFFILRFSGQGVLTMATRNMAMKWFNRRRGITSAIMGIVSSLALSFSPGIIDSYSNNEGWEKTWTLTGIIILTFFIVFVFIFYKDNPRQYGLNPDGKLKVKKQKSGPVYKPIKDYSLQQARKTLSFWVFTISLAMITLFYTALTFHVVSIFEEANIGRNIAVSIFVPSSIIAIGLQFLAGYIADYIKIKYLLALEIFGILVSSIGVLFLSEGLFLWLVIIGNGIAVGLYGILLSVTWPRFYGVTHLGAISGFNLTFLIAGSAIGPFLYSLSLANTGSYNSATVLCIFSFIILFVLSFWANNVNEKKEKAFPD